MHQLKLTCNIFELQQFHDYVSDNRNVLPPILGMDQFLDLIKETVTIRKQLCLVCQEKRIVVELNHFPSYFTVTYSAGA